jgi:hypothetical protein
MLTRCRSIRLAVGLLGRLRIAVRLAAVADLDATISNVSPSTPIRGGASSSSILHSIRAVITNSLLTVPLLPILAPEAWGAEKSCCAPLPN